MAIDLQEIIKRVTSVVEEPTKTAETAEVVTAAATPASEVIAPVVTAVAAVAPVASEVEDLKKVAAEMDEAGRVMARAFYDELTKLGVGVHGYVDSKADFVPENPATMVSKAPERLDNALKAVSILQQLTAGERAHGNDGYIQVNGQPVASTSPEIGVEEHPVAVDVAKSADAKIITNVFNRFFGGK
jgi:hypothetical protein